MIGSSIRRSECMPAVMVLPAAAAGEVSADDSASTETARLVASVRRFQREVWNIQSLLTWWCSGVKLIKARLIIVRRVHCACSSILKRTNTLQQHCFRDLHQSPCASIAFAA